MAEKMPPIRVAAAILGSIFAIFLLWRAVSFFPAAWNRFGHRGHTEVKVVHIDSTLFDQEAAGSAELGKSLGETPLDALLAKELDSLGVFRDRISAVRAEGGDVRLHSIQFRAGAPLLERVRRFVDAVRSQGYSVSGSTERPRAAWPWALRVQRGDTLVALVRGRVDGPAAAGSYLVHLGFVDICDGRPVPSLAGLPPGVLVALSPAAYEDPKLGATLRGGGWQPAIVARMEASRLPVPLQKERILLQHQKDDIEHRLLLSDSCRKVPRGLVVSDGDLGAADPSLARKMAEFARDRGWWIMDATGASSSRLEEQALSAGVGILGRAGHPREGASAALALAQEQAVAEGESYLLLPLDSSSVRRAVSYLPLMSRKGVAVAPWPVEHPRPRRD